MTGSNLITSSTAGYPVPGGGEYPFPGVSGKISHNFPSPFVSSGHGGGIRIAEIPIGFPLQDLIVIDNILLSFKGQHGI